jgi:hypothetical protein
VGAADQAIRNRLSDQQHCDQRSGVGEQAAAASHKKHGLIFLLQNCLKFCLNASYLGAFLISPTQLANISTLIEHVVVVVKH